VLRTGLSSLRDRAAARLAASRFNPSREPEPEPRTLRLVNYGISQVFDGGQRIKIYGWTHRIPFDGDYLILNDQRGGTTRYRAIEVRCPGNPSDMFFADAEFSPR
jgi:hypothetical protein